LNGSTTGQSKSTARLAEELDSEFAFSESTQGRRDRRDYRTLDCELIRDIVGVEGNIGPMPTIRLSSFQ
jgi:hypothetical protein